MCVCVCERERERDQPAVNNHGSFLVGMILSYTFPKAEKGRGKLRDAMVRPDEEVELLDLSHRHLNFALTSNLE